MRIENNSGYRPVGHAVLLRAVEQMENGKIHIPDPVKESMASCDVMGIVVALGGDCWNGPNETPRAEPGDQVLVTRYAGGVIKGDDGYVYKLVPDHSIYAVKEKADG